MKTLPLFPLRDVWLILKWLFESVVSTHSEQRTRRLSMQRKQRRARVFFDLP
jgi:hypothetical protein